MQRKDATMVFYHVPEDKDDPESPNVFSLPVSKQKLRLKHINQHFPLRGTYALRFKVAYDGFIVWLDLSDPQAEVPLFKDKVYLKANRLSWKEQQPHQIQQPATQSSKSINKSQEFSLFDHHQGQTSQPQTKNQSLSQPQLQPQFAPKPNSGDPFDLNLFEHSNPAAEQKQKVDFFAEGKKEAKKNLNLMGFSAHGDLI